MKRTFYSLLAIVCLVLVFGPVAGFAKKKKSKQTKKEQVATVAKASLPHDKQMRYDYFFQGAMIRLNSNDAKSAFELLNHCIDINPEAAEAYFYLADIYRSLGQDSMQVAMIKRAVELRPDNDTYKEELIPIYLNQNDLTNAAVLMEELVAATPERTDMLQVLLQIYNYQKDYDRCLSVLNKLAVQEGQNEQITMAKVQIYNKLGDDKNALKELKDLVHSHPLDLNYRVMMGNWLLSKGNKREAVQEFRTVLNEEPDNEQALMSMMDYYRAEGLDSLANEQHVSLLVNERTQPETRLLLMKQFIKEQELHTTDSTKVLEMFDKVATMNPSELNMLELKAAYMTQKSMPNDSIAKVLDKILTISPDDIKARYTLMQFAAAKNDYDEIIRICLPAVEFNREEWFFCYFLGLAYWQKDQHKDAIKAFEQGAELLEEFKNDDMKIATEMYARLGDVLHTEGEKERSYEAYEKSLQYDAENITCLNNYAYYLSEEGGDLEKAAAMSLKTIKQEPNNATYLDTYAWILYLQERYEEAKIYIDMALKNLNTEEDNTVIKEHAEKIEASLQKSNK